MNALFRQSGLKGSTLFGLVSVLWLCFLPTGCSSQPGSQNMDGGKKPAVLHLFTWSDYLDPELVTLFERENNCKLVIDYFESNEAMYAKLKAGGGGYDLLVPSTYILPLLQREGLIQPLDHSLIPNLKQVDRQYTRLLTDPEMSYSVPYMVSYTGIGYSDDIPDLEQSWSVLGRQDLKGRLTLLDDPRETIGVALLYHGNSLNTLDDEALKRARDTVIQWKQVAAKFENTQYHHGLASGEFRLSLGYSGDVLQVQRENPSIKFMLPKEGFPFTCDLVVVSAKAPAPELAHRFINFLHRPDVAARNTTAVRFLCPNTGSYPLLEEALRNNPAIFPTEEVLARAEPIRDLGENNRKYTQIWDEIKAAGGQ